MLSAAMAPLIPQNSVQSTHGPSEPLAPASLMMTTSETLLGELREAGQPAAWNKFVQLYSPLLYSWLRRTGMQEADAADVLQEVFRVLVIKLPQFEYDRDKSFRSWLRVIFLNVWKNYCRQSARHAAMLANLENCVGQDDIFSETQYRQQVVAAAMELLRPEFQPQTWQAFVGHGVENRSAAEVAAELGTTVGAVYSARCRVLARMRSYLQGLID